MRLLEQFWPYAALVLAGYLIRVAQVVIGDVLVLAKEASALRRVRRDAAETERILGGIQSEPEPTLSLIHDRPISPSPMATRYSWQGPSGYELPITGLRSPRCPPAIEDSKVTWPDQPEPLTVTKVSWVRRWRDETRPRTPAQVAEETYQEILAEAGLAYWGRHRPDGYTKEQLKVILTSTSQFPSLRRLRGGWQEPAPEARELFV